MQTRSVYSPLVTALVHHYDALVTYLCRKQRSGHDGHTGVGLSTDEVAREAVHEVCLQLLHEEPHLGQVRIPIAFLRTLTKRRAIDVLRREKAWHLPLVSQEETVEHLELAGSVSLQPDARLLAMQQLQQLANAIEALPPRCRDVFVLCKIHGWSQQDVAIHLDIAVRTVEHHVRIATACCRVALTDVWEPKA